MRWLLVVMLFSAVFGVAKASDPPVLPILRVETGMHTTLIRRLVVDAPRNRLVTCADDKTIRVWQMPGGRLLATLRVPIDSGHEGQLYGLAVSPDGRTIAAGGWTGWDWEGNASIYLFDVASGELARRLGGFPDAINALAWSPDGHHLAVGMHGRAGLAVVRVADGAWIARDGQYLDKLTDLDFDGEGHLVAVALDGMARLYDKDFRLLGRRVISGGKKPVAVKFSPDGARFAVAFADAPVVSIGSGRDLATLRHLDLGGKGGQESFLTVAWSSDGEYLYAGGDFRGAGQNPLYRWNTRDWRTAEAFPLTANRISEIQRMPEGHIAYAAEDPAFGVVDATGRVKFVREPDIHDFSMTHGLLRVSSDGSMIGYPARRDGSLMHGFSALGGGDQTPTAAPGTALASPRLQAANFVLENWQNTYYPRINGRVPRLDDYEMARSHAFAPDGNAVLLGTEWALRLLDRDAREAWHVKLAAVAWAVNISANGQVAVAALSDGSIRWHAMRDGRELLAYFPHRNGEDWIAWLPNGYYISSVLGDNYIGWHVNRGKDATPDFHRAVQFDRVLYRPDVFHDAVEAALLPADKRSTPKTRHAAIFDISRIQEIAPPRLRLRATGIERLGEELQLRLQVSGEGGGRPAEDVAIFVNGIPMTPASERRVFPLEAGRFSSSFAVPLGARENEIRAESFNGISMGIAETFLVLPERIETRQRPGDLYLLAVGVNDFPKLFEGAELAYAARDAESISQAIARHGAGQYRNVFVKLINDFTPEKPERNVILDAMDFIRKAQARDTVAIFLASHGLSDAAGNYYFVPRDAVTEDIARIGKGKEITSLLPWTVFFDTLRATPGRRLLIVDTCQARNIEGRFEPHSLMKRSAASQFSLIVASKGEEESQEHPAKRHGLFTYSLLQAMQADADGNHDGTLTLQEWFSKAAAILEQERDKSAGPQTPQLIVPPALRDLGLIHVTTKNKRKLLLEGRD